MVYLTVFQTNSSCQDKAGANPADGVCETESFVFRADFRKVHGPRLDLDLNVHFAFSQAFLREPPTISNEYLSWFQ